MRVTWQYSTRALLILITGLCVWLGVTVNSARVQRELTTAIEEVGGSVAYNWQMSESGQETGRTAPPGPAWLRRLLGDDYFQSVVGVYFGEAPLVDADIPEIERLETVRFLSFGTTMVSDATLLRISSLPRLKFLDVAFTNVTDAGMEHVARISGLQELWAGNWRLREGGTVGDKGLYSVRNLTRLSKLDLNGGAVSDRCIDTLKAMPSLREVKFTSTSVTTSGENELRRARPGCAVWVGVY